MDEGKDCILIGDILKQERLRLGYTREQIAERPDIGTRYLTAIENNEKKPKFDVLYRLIRGIGISADTIFYPENRCETDETKRLIRLLQNCAPRDRRLVIALTDTPVDTRQKETPNHEEDKGAT